MRSAHARRVRGVVVACALVLVCAAVSATSSASAAGFGIERYSLTATEGGGSEDTKAGSHPYELTADVAVARDGDLIDDLRLELPTGVVLDAQAVQRCAAAEFLDATCPEGTAVGVAVVGTAEKTYPAAVYNLAPEPGELAQLGFVVDDAHLVVKTALRPGSGGMTLSIDHILPVAAFDSFELTLWGNPGDQGHDALRGLCATGEATNCTGGGWGAFVTLPTACDEALDTSTMAAADPWEEAGVWSSAGGSLPRMSGCERLSFEPAIGVAPELPRAYTPSGYGLELRIPQDEEPQGLATSQLQGAQLTLPAGVSLSLAYLDSAESCSEAQIELQSNEPASCPNASTLGRVEIDTPLLSGPLQGRVYLAAQSAHATGSLVGFYVDATAPSAGMTVKLTGQLVPNPATGQLAIVLAGMPQLPIAKISLKLYGGANSVLDNPQTCGQVTATGQLTPWDGGAQTAASSPFEVEPGRSGEVCPGVLPFAPILSAEPVVTTAGDYTPLVLTFVREDREQDLAGFSLRLPAGLEWAFAGVPLCAEPQAREGTCPPASQIGTTTVSVGDGDVLAWFMGVAYLTEGHNGAPYGLSIAIDVLAGPLDLGQAVIQAALEVEPGSGAVTVTSDPTPQLIDGIAMPVRTFTLTIDRPEFLLNSSICAPGQITATAQGSQGASVQASTPFTDTGCQNPPAIPASTSGGAEGAVTSRVALDGGAITVQSSGKAAVKLTCRGTETCSGKLTLTVKTMRGKREHRHSKTTMIGTGTFSIPEGETTTVKLTLNAAGRALLSAAHGHLSATLTVLKSSPLPPQTHSENVRLVQQKLRGKAKK